MVYGAYKIKRLEQRGGRRRRETWALVSSRHAPMEAKAVPRSGWRWGAVRMAEAGRTPDAATPRAMLSARLPGPMKPTRNASPFTAAGGGGGTGWRGGAAIARETERGRERRRGFGGLGASGRVRREISDDAAGALW